MKTENNKINIVGKIITEPVFMYNKYNETFYTCDIEVPRKSNAVDTIPIIISSKIMMNIHKGLIVAIQGQLRRYHINETINKHFVFTQEIEIINSEDFIKIKNLNTVNLTGFILKEPIFRTTALGRKITDLKIIVPRSHNKSDYISTIAWGRNAIFANSLKKKDEITLLGRLQSRKYYVKHTDKVIDIIEVSISTLDKKEIVQGSDF